MTSGGRCIIPELSVSALTSSVRLSLIREDESGAETYMFNPESVNNGKSSTFIHGIESENMLLSQRLALILISAVLILIME